MSHLDETDDRRQRPSPDRKVPNDNELLLTPIMARFPERLYEALLLDVFTPQPGDPESDAFLDDHPSFDGLAVRVAGSYDGNSFVFERALDASVAIALDEVFVGDEGANLTVAVAVREWFMSAEATPAPFDPATAAAGGANDSRFVGNFVASFRAFRDLNRNGVFDGDEL